MLRKSVVIVICAIMLISSFMVLELSDEGSATQSGYDVLSSAQEPPVAAYVSHPPVRIDSNADFDLAHGVVGGDGTELNPWIIENWDINGTGFGYCIYIGNTTEYFVVRTCHLYDAVGVVPDPQYEYFTNSGLIIRGADNGKIENNTLSGSDFGIHVPYSSSNFVIMNNMISDNLVCGILLYTGYITIFNNTILRSNYGINLALSSNNIIENNIISEQPIGIRLFDGNNNNQIANNTISWNTEYGIYIRAPMMSQANNRFYHNIIENNLQNAYDDSPSSLWDGGYPYGGNYWGDYSGNDVSYGPLQDMVGSDFVGDTPYTNIGGVSGAQDNYPLFENLLESVQPAMMEVDVTLNLDIIVVFNTTMDTLFVPMVTQTTGTLVTNSFIEWSQTNVPNDTCRWSHPDWGGEEYITLILSGYRSSLGEIGLDYTWGFTTGELPPQPPLPPTGLTVDQWWPADIQFFGGWTNYLRSDSVNVNTLDAYSMSDTQTLTSTNSQVSIGGTLYTGMRVWHRAGDGTEIELTGGTAEAIVLRSTNAEGIQTTTWSCPQTPITPTNSLVVRVYQDFDTPVPTTLAAEFTTGPIDATQINASTWTINYYTYRTGNNNQQRIGQFHWGSTSYNSNIGNIMYTLEVPASTLGNIVNWTLSADDGAGDDDIASYWVYRSDVESGPWDIAHRIVSISAGDNWYLDFEKGTADSVLWWYVVRAVDTEGIEEMNTNAVIEGGAPAPVIFNIPVHDGWNFISFPLAVSGSPDTVLSDLAGDGTTQWDVIKYYDSTDSADPWKTYRVGAGSTNDLLTLNNCMGLWVHIIVSGDDLLTIQGSIPASTDIDLYPGWNLVSFPSATDELASNALLGTGADWIAVYDSVAPFVRDENDLSTVTMSQGNAYWVHVSAYTTWTVAY